MIKYIKVKNIIELNQLQNLLLNQNVSIWNIFKDNNKNVLSFFYNEDVQTINLKSFVEDE